MMMKKTFPLLKSGQKKMTAKIFPNDKLKKRSPEYRERFSLTGNYENREEKSGNKHTSRHGGGKRKKTEEEDEDEKKKKKMRKEDTDFKQIKKYIEEMEMKNSDMDLLAKHLVEKTQGKYSWNVSCMTRY